MLKEIVFGSRYFGATFDDVAIHMQETYDGGFIILGKTNSFDSAHIYLIKTDSLGIIASPFKITGPGNYFCKGDSVQLNIEPKPDSNYTVEWSSGELVDTLVVVSNGNYTATITDSSGASYKTPNYFLFFATISDANLSNLDTIRICSGAPLVNLAPSSLSFTYTWFLDDTLLTDIKTNYLIPERIGNYSLRVDNYCGTDSDSVVLDSLFSLPDVPVMNISGNKFICEGDSLTLFIPDSGLDYQWWFAKTGKAQPVLGANDTSFMAYSEGIYFVFVSDSNTCSSSSNPLNIFIDTYPAYVNISGPLSFCQGGHVILSAPSGSDYLWNTGDTINSLFINSSGDFSYSMTSMFGCPKFSDTVSTEVYLKPYINLGQDTTVCNTEIYLIDAGPGYSSYQWQDGSSNQVFIASTSSTGIDTGTYYVEVSDINACLNTDTVYVIFDICQGGIAHSGAVQTKLFPTILSQGDAFFVFNSTPEEAQFNIRSASGQDIGFYRAMPGKTEFVMPELASGIYFYSIYNQKDWLQSGKFVVE